MSAGGRNRAERRLSAILAADVAGYSRLIGADEEGTLDRLRSIRAELIDPKIAEHRGRLVKTTGDGLLVEFASVVDALRCATAVQQAMVGRNTEAAATERIEFRIAFTRVTSSSRMATFSATGSMSPPGSKRWPSRATFVY
jgi:class 3 adenylate cyclase